MAAAGPVRALLPRTGRLSRARRGITFRGITLVELLLALAILVAMAALAAPAVNRSWERYRVKLAGDQLRAAFTHAHVEAMRKGQIQVVRFEMGGNRYYLQPWMAGDEVINASAEEALQQTQMQVETGAPQEQQLPEDVTFAAASAEFDTRAIEIEEVAAQQQGMTVQWSQPILFYPDGTSSSATVAVANKRGQAVQVRLRKLTGLTTVSDVTTLEALAEKEAIGFEELP